MLHQSGFMKLFSDIEIPLLSVLATMEAEGVKLDIKALKKFSEELQQEILTVESSIYELANVKFNIASPKQLGDVLFEKLVITSKPKTYKNQAIFNQ